MHADLDILFELVASGVHVVLAHPERYVLFQKNPNLLDKYTDMGILLQGNYESLCGKYGKKTQALMKQWLKEKRYFTLSSDVHKENSSFFKNFPKVQKKLLKLVDTIYLQQLQKENPQKILDGVYVEND